MAKFQRLSQIPPMPGANAGMPPIMPGMAPGMPPTDPMAAMMGGAAPGAPPVQPMAAPAQAPPRPEINGPLDSLSKLLYDVDITKLIENHGGDKPDEIALEVWKTFGGEPNGMDDKKQNLGERTKENDQLGPEDAVKERSNTEDEKWKRLPKGKSISDITSLDDMAKSMQGISLGTVKQETKERGGAGAAPPGGAPPGAPPMPTAATNSRVILSRSLDKLGYYRQADYLDYLLCQSAKGNR